MGLLFRVQSGADGGEKMGVFGVYDMGVVQLQGADKGLLQF